MAVYTTVPYGPLLGLTKAQLLTKLTALITARDAQAAGASSAIFAASVNGTSVQYAVSDMKSKGIEEQINDVMSALKYVSDDAEHQNPATNFQRGRICS